MRAFYARIPTAADLKGTGLTPADYDEDDFEVWPDNMPALRLFITLQTQLRSWGGGGAMGFDYGVYFSRMDRMSLTPQAYEWMFDDIREIEPIALKAINSKD